MPAAIKGLFAIELGLAIMHLLNPPVPLWAARGGSTRYMWELDAEANVPTWFASAQLAVLAAAVLIFAVAWRQRSHAQAFALGTVGVACLALSLDELIGAHEKLGRGLEELSGPRGPTAFDATGPWVAIAAPVFLIAALVVAYSLRGLFRDRRRPALLCLAGTTLFFVSFAGLELVANFLASDDDHTVLFEETGEMAGATLVLWGVYELMHSHGLRLVGTDPHTGR